MRLEDQLLAKSIVLQGMPRTATDVDAHFAEIKSWAADPDQGDGSHGIIKQETVKAVAEGANRAKLHGKQMRIVCECYGKPPAGSPSKKTSCKWVVWIEEAVKLSTGPSGLLSAQTVSIVTKADLEHSGHSCSHSGARCPGGTIAKSAVGGTQGTLVDLLER